VKARSRALPDFPPLSLLFPQGKRVAAAAEPAWARDLRLDDLIGVFAAEPRYAAFIRQTLTALTADPEVIAWRQAVLDDFLENAALVQTVEQLLPRLAELRQGRALLGQRQRPPLLETADRLAELDLFISTAQLLHEALQKATLRAAALRTLRDQLARLIADPNFVALRDELPMLQRPLQKLASLTIGVNLDAQLQPSAAVLLSINEQPFGEPRSFLSKLIGQRADPNDESPIAPLHTLPEERHYRLLSPLFQDLERIVSSVVQPVARSLSKYVRISAAPLTNLEQELAFYLSAVRLVQLLRERGIPLTQPQVMASEARLTRIEGLISSALGLAAAAGCACAERCAARRSRSDSHSDRSEQRRQDDVLASDRLGACLVSGRLADCGAQRTAESCRRHFHAFSNARDAATRSLGGRSGAPAPYLPARDGAQLGLDERIALKHSRQRSDVPCARCAMWLARHRRARHLRYTSLGLA
jgi:hypothetical protein